MAEGKYEHGLERHPSNRVPLTPLDFLERSAAVYASTGRAALATLP